MLIYVVNADDSFVLHHHPKFITAPSGYQVRAKLGFAFSLGQVEVQVSEFSPKLQIASAVVLCIMPVVLNTEHTNQ